MLTSAWESLHYPSCYNPFQTKVLLVIQPFFASRDTNNTSVFAHLGIGFLQEVEVDSSPTPLHAATLLTQARDRGVSRSGRRVHRPPAEQALCSGLEEGLHAHLATTIPLAIWPPHRRLTSNRDVNVDPAPKAPHTLSVSVCTGHMNKAAAMSSGLCPLPMVNS